MGRNLAKHLGSVACGVYFVEIILIQRYDGTLYTVHLFQIVGFKISGHSLRHTADKHIQPKIAHQLAVRGVTHGRPAVKTSLEQPDCGGVPQCPPELLVIHGKHVEFDFLARNQDVPDILTDRNQRTGFHVIISAVLYKILDCLPRLGCKLDFIENDDRLPFLQLDTVFQL